MPCTCTSNILDEDCRYTLECLTGVAKRRADTYVSGVSGIPTATDIRQAALQRVADLGGCERVRAELADVFASWATMQLVAKSLRPDR